MKKPEKPPTDSQKEWSLNQDLGKPVGPDTLPLLARYKSGDSNIPAGKDLFQLGEPCDTVYNLVEGWVFLYNLLEDGRRQILHFAFPGAVLGLHPATAAPLTYGAQALTDTVAYIIPQKNFQALSREYPEIGLQLAWLAARDRSLVFDHITDVGQQSARVRVARLILDLFFRSQGRWPAAGRVEHIDLPLTQEHIADATGLTTVHVNRVLRELRQAGVLEFHYQRLAILNPQKFADVAEVDPSAMAQRALR